MKPELISDVLVGAQKATALRGGSVIDLSDVCAAIVELHPVQAALTHAGILPRPSGVVGRQSVTGGTLGFEADEGSSGELRPHPELRQRIEALPDGTSRPAALLYLFDAGVAAGRASFTGEQLMIVRGALQDLD